MTKESKTKRRKRSSLVTSTSTSHRKRHRPIHSGATTHDGCNKVLIFQQLASSLLDTDRNSHHDIKSHEQTLSAKDETIPTDDTASLFFELANSPLIGYQLSNQNNSNRNDDDEPPTIVIRQDNQCQVHTGGIVWETSYLLAQFLQEKFYGDCHATTWNTTISTTVNKPDCHPLGKTLEIGSGCGMLGIILAANQLSSKVILTEASEVMDLLNENVNENIVDCHNNNEESRTIPCKGIHGTNYRPCCFQHSISVRQLRWDHFNTDIQASAESSNTTTDSSHDLEPHSFDTILGTDVVFSPSLVRPLLKTIAKMARKRKSSQKRNTLIYLCLQIRCTDSHALLFSEAGRYGLEVMDRSEELNIANCAWGLELECVLLQMNVVKKKRCK